MSLFVGGLSTDLRTRELEDIFERYGRLRNIEIRSTYAFVEFEDDRDAEDAMRALNGREFGRSRLKIEWSRRSGRWDPRSVENERCYNCNEYGHFARDCPRRYGSSRGRSRSRSRSRSPRRRRSPSPRRRSPSPRRRSPSPSRRRSRSRSRSADRGRRNRSAERSISPRKSPAPARGRSRSRSRSRDRSASRSRSPAERREKSPAPASNE